jgi:predicted nucleic acid-binding Zn ribbon protein
MRSDFRTNNELNIYLNGGGYSSVGTFKSGDAVFVGSGFWRYRSSDSNNKDVSTIGNIITGGIYHYPIKLKIEVQKGKAVAFGEIIVRAIPKEYCGNLRVKVETDEGLKLTDAGVTLKVSGFYSGKTEPVKEGSCLFSSIGPGEYSVEIAQNNTFGSPSQTAVVATGQTTEITINAYRQRLIELDWRFHKVNEPNNWLSGQKTIRTKEYWQPDDEWIDVHYPVLEFSDWAGNTCNIKRFNGELMHVDTNEPFEKMDFPLNFSPFSRDYPIKEGDIFAWRRNEPKTVFSEALIRIRKITPIGMPDR